VEQQSTWYFYSAIVCRGPRILTVVLQFLLTCVLVLLVLRQINGHVYDTIRRQHFEVPYLIT